VNPDEAGVWKTEHLPHFLQGYMSYDIFNGDECRLFYDLLPNKTYAHKEEHCHREKMRKEKITVLLAANMDGSEKLSLLIIGKSEKPHCFKNNKAVPCKSRHNKTMWMTCMLFERVLADAEC
jgi:hypothetical protein